MRKDENASTTIVLYCRVESCAQEDLWVTGSQPAGTSKWRSSYLGTSTEYGVVTSVIGVLCS